MMNNEELTYQPLEPIDKNTFIKKMANASQNEYPKLLIQLREADDLDFAEKIFSQYIYDNDITVAETALYSLGYLSIIRKRLLDLSIIDELEKLAIKNSLLEEVIEDTIWEIKQPWEEIKIN